MTISVYSGKFLTEIGIKNNVDRFVKILYAATEIIRYFDQGETAFNNKSSLSIL